MSAILEGRVFSIGETSKFRPLPNAGLAKLPVKRGNGS
jgi:hypothetical protein